MTTGDQAGVVDMGVAKLDSLAGGYADEEAKLDCPAAVASMDETAGLAEDELRLTADLAPAEFSTARKRRPSSEGKRSPAAGSVAADVIGRRYVCGGQRP